MRRIFRASFLFLVLCGCADVLGITDGKPLLDGDGGMFGESGASDGPSSDGQMISDSPADSPEQDGTTDAPTDGANDAKMDGGVDADADADADTGVDADADAPDDVLLPPKDGGAQVDF